MQQRGTKLSPYAFNPFICDFARWGMHDEVSLQGLEILSFVGVTIAFLTKELGTEGPLKEFAGFTFVLFDVASRRLK
jgi:hypothetical protein